MPLPAWIALGVVAFSHLFGVWQTVELLRLLRVVLPLLRRVSDAPPEPAPALPAPRPPPSEREPRRSRR